jgi:hypothetical protein
MLIDPGCLGNRDFYLLIFLTPCVLIRVLCTSVVKPSLISTSPGSATLPQRHRGHGVTRGLAVMRRLHLTKHSSSLSTRREWGWG